MNVKYIVTLSEEEREQLKDLLSSGIAPARTLKHAHILLKSDTSAGSPQWDYDKICEAFTVAPLTVYNVRKRYVEEGLAAALYRKKPDREYQHSLDGEAEAHLIAMVCEEPPADRGRWSLRLLQKRMIELNYVESISHETIRTTLKKTILSHG